MGPVRIGCYDTALFVNSQVSFVRKNVKHWLVTNVSTGMQVPRG